MCGPMALAAAQVGMQALPQVIGFIGQTQQAEANERAANITYAQTQNELGRRATEIDAQQSENTLNAIIERAREQGRISASASAMGTSGATTAGLMNQAANEAGRSAAIDELNSRNLRLQLADQRTRAEFQRVSQINQVPRPSALSLILGLTGSAIGGANAYTQAGGRLPGGGAEGAEHVAQAVAAG